MVQFLSTSVKKKNPLRFLYFVMDATKNLLSCLQLSFTLLLYIYIYIYIYDRERERKILALLGKIDQINF